METKNLEAYRHNLRHSAAHLLAEAVLKLYPNAKITLGPPITDGFYYDFDIDITFSPQDLIAIEREMKRSVKRNSKFECNELSRAEALEVYKDNPYKIEIIKMHISERKGPVIKAIGRKRKEYSDIFCKLNLFIKNFFII